MANKKRVNFATPASEGHSFDDEDFILNHRPIIEFVEPPQVDQGDLLPDPEPETIDSLRGRTRKLVNGLRALSKLADLAQKRIDNRVEAAGGMTVKLDAVKDRHIVAAMKRVFPEKEDPSNITYNDYKKALDCLHSHAPEGPRVTAEQIRAAKSDPLRTDFGGFSNQQGQNRPEISSPAISIQPVDIDKFQKAAVLGLFALMRPLIKGEDAAAIAKHLLSAKHF